MMGKKKLDKLFQEKFKDFREVPDDKVWHAVETSLDKKKRRRAIPIWWKLGGAAAVLAIFLVAINPFSGISDTDPAVTDIELQDQDAPNRQKDRLEDKKLPGPTVVDTEEGDGAPDATSTSIATSDDGAIDKDTMEHVLKNDGNLLPSSLEKKETRLTSVQKEERPVDAHDDPSIKKDRGEITVPEKETGIARVPDDVPERNAPENQLDLPVQEGVAQIDAKQESDPGALDKNSEKGREVPKDPIASAEEGVAQIDEKVEDKIKDEDQKKSIYDEIDDDEEAIVEARKNRWSAGPSIAPVYSDAFGEGSAVHSIFVPNAKSGETNLSYGLSVAYEISDKLSIRSGIHKVDYGYGTSDVEFSSSFEGSANDGQIENIDYALTSRNLVLQSKANSSSFIDGDPNLQALDISAQNPARDGSMSQQFGYLEVPLELNYALVDRKIGVNLIGGVSSLFLVDNSISVSSGNQTMEMGEANNVNSVNFSTNVGFGIDYNFTPKIKLNIEPVFKYQLNTFSDVDGTFQPYSIGVYSGLSFKF